MRRIYLAGPAAEAGYVDKIDWDRTRFRDLDEARAILTRNAWLRVTLNRDLMRPELCDVETALRGHFKEACQLLFPHCGLVEDLANRLMERGTLSARTVKAICRSWE